MSCAAKSEDDTPGELTAAQARPDEIAKIFTRLMDQFNLSDFERELVLQKLNEANLSISTPRAGTTLTAVVDFCKRDKGRGQTFTLEEVRTALDKSRVNATPKEVYNALGYLTRKKHIHRLARGEYAVGDAQQGGD